MFQNLRANNQLFILHKEAKHYVEIGSVVSVSAPKPKYPMTQPFPSPQIEMVVDVVASINGQNTTFQNLPAGGLRTEREYRGLMFAGCDEQ